MSDQNTAEVNAIGGIYPTDNYAENSAIDSSSADFTAGFALCLAEMLRNGAEPSAAEATVSAAGISLEDFHNAGVPEFDWDTINDHKAELWPDEFPTESE